MSKNKACPFCLMKNLFKKPLVEVEEKNFNNGVLLTPPMGWSSWNCFKNKINEEQLLDVANALVKCGLLDAGYKYFNLDDDWHSNLRDENGELQGDLSKFPRNIKPLVKDLNELGLKVGIYSSNGTLTCEDLPASENNELKDAYTFAKWGIEYFKYDFCHNEPLSQYAPLVSLMSLAPLGEKEKYVLSADTAHLEGTAKVMKDKKMPNGVFVSGLDKNKGSMAFENIMIEKAGKYALTLTVKKYGKKYDKYARVLVNGTDAYEISTPGCQPWNEYTRCQVVVELKEGANTIKIYNPVSDSDESAHILYHRMGNALDTAVNKYAKENNIEPKPIGYSICEWGKNRPYKWGRFTGNLWRTTPDIRPWFEYIKLLYRKTVRLYEYSGVGTYNDPDMLEVGNGKLTETQNKAHFSLWCMMASPLILGNDLRKLILPNGEVDTNNATLRIVTNKNLIAIDQDKLCQQAKPLKLGLIDILARPLEGGRVALAFFNIYSLGKRKVRFDINDLINDKYTHLDNCTNYKVVDQWTNEEVTLDKKILNTVVEKDEVKVYIITPEERK